MLLSMRRRMDNFRGQKVLYELIVAMFQGGYSEAGGRGEECEKGGEYLSEGYIIFDKLILVGHKLRNPDGGLPED